MRRSVLDAPSPSAQAAAVTRGASAGTSGRSTERRDEGPSREALRRLALVAIALALSAGASCFGTATAESGSRPSSPSAQNPGLLYVANQGAASVSIIDTERGELVEVIRLEELGFGPTARPHHIAVEPDGSFWYVSLIGENRVLKFDRENRLVASTEFERPGMLALHPSDDFLFVGRSMAAVKPPQRIGRLRRSTMEVEQWDVFVPRPHAMAVSRDGGWVFTSSLAENTLVAVNTETGEAELTRLGAQDPHVFVQFALSPDGRRLVATAQLSGKLLVFDVSEPPEIRLLLEIDVNAQPWHPIFSPNGCYVYFGNLAANTVTIVDAEKWQVAAMIEGDGLSEPHGIAIAPDGKRLYVSNRNTKGAYTPSEDLGFETPNGTLIVIDAESREIVKVIEVPAYPAGLGPASPG